MLEGDPEDDCPYCGGIERCEPGCVMTACGECGGVGRVINLSAPVLDPAKALPGTQAKVGERWYWTKPCPRGCQPPSQDPPE